MSSVLKRDSVLREAVKKLIVVDVSVRHPSGNSIDLNEDKLYRLMVKMLEVNRMKTIDRAQVIKTLSDVESDLNVINFLLLNLVKGDAGCFTFNNLAVEHLKVAWPILKRTWKEDFVSWNGDALFLKGEYSDYVRPSDEEEIKRLFPISRIETISKSGHWPNFDNPSEFINKLVPFL